MSRHQMTDFVDIRLFGIELPHNFPAIEYDQAVAERKQLFQVFRNQHNACAALACLDEYLPRPNGALHVEPARKISCND